MTSASIPPPSGWLPAVTRTERHHPPIDGLRAIAVAGGGAIIDRIDGARPDVRLSDAVDELCSAATSPAEPNGAVPGSDDEHLKATAARAHLGFRAVHCVDRKQVNPTR